MMKKQTLRRHHDSGFTIIELLVATAVFAVVLVVVTAGIMLFTRDYYKGMVQATTQSTARTIINTIGQAIQFSPLTNTYPGWPGIRANGSVNGYCINGVSYNYVLGKQLGGTGTYTTNQTLIATTNVTCDSSMQANLSGGGTELVGKHMRLAVFVVTPVSGSPDSYQIDVRVVYGDDDLLCSPNEVAGSCNTSAAMSRLSDYQTPDLQCKGQTGSQYCAVSELSTVVKKRL